MTGNGLPVPGFTGDGYIVGTTLHITTASTGELVPGSLIVGTGVLADTVVTAFGSGEGGTGTYTVNQSQTVFSSGTPGAMTSPSNVLIPHCTVGYYAAGSAGGVASIKLTN